MASTQCDEAPPPLKLGLFMPNCSGWSSISSRKLVADDWTYDSNLKIAQRAEQLGFELLFPVSKWRGYGGVTNYLGHSLETMTWASALLAQTSRINVFSTVHVPLFHPVVTAKMGATLDHIGNGRWGLNVVSGWSEREFGMMGVEVIPHAERYQRMAAYIEIIKGLWTSEPGKFSYDSPWYRITDGEVLPGPVQRPHPAIANAGNSEEAREMTARLCDWAFIAAGSIEQAGEFAEDIQRRAANYQRQVHCAVYPYVLWRDSAAEAEAEKARIVAAMDRVATENWARGLFGQSGSFDPSQYRLEMFCFGGGALPIVGTAE
jgi:alkanesulfonate monooxygenase SsuD/methylene tetrahydromethanopterin reductase-like flavin-dependent oxidoreductase (luciferase family)